MLEPLTMESTILLVLVALAAFAVVVTAIKFAIRLAIRLGLVAAVVLAALYAAGLVSP